MDAHMLKTIAFFVAAACFSGAAGCRSPSSGDQRPVAVDPVCLFNRDLGCVNIHVDAATPRAEHAGKTYYFCNQACRDAFVHEPEKYLAALDRG